MNKNRFYLSVYVVLLCCVSAQAGQTRSLEGLWRFALDRNDQGVANKWYAKDLEPSDVIRLPGSLQEQGFGDVPSAKTDWTTDIGKKLLEDPRFQEYIQAEDFKSPFWLTPARHYIGPAWYQRTVTIPDTWKGQRIVLHLERPHWQTSVWVNQTRIGAQDSLGTPHEYVLTDVLTPGTHRLTIRVDNRVLIPVGYDAHSISDQTQTNWNGIIGKLYLLAKDPSVWFEDVQVFPDIEKRSIRVSATMEAGLAQSVQGVLRVRAESFNSGLAHRVAERAVPVNLQKDEGRFEFEYAMGRDVQLWDEFSPTLYRLTLRFEPKDEKAESVEHAVVFGMRELGIEDTQFTLNGRPIYLRGTLECAIFPKTGYPPMDIDAWKRILRACRDHGLNHLRFHSWCPPKAAFEAADEMGFYLQAEASCWATFGDGTAVDKWVYEESHRMLKEYGNHPSFILMSPSNEPHGQNRDVFLGKLINHLAETDTRRRYTAGAGWPLIPENQFHIAIDARIERFAPLRLSDRPQTHADYRRFVARYDVPTVSHEIAQWCVYPNLAERFKYDGSLTGGNIEIARDMLEKAGLLHLGHDFLMASGMFQTLLYKTEIEAALRTPGFGGFQLLDLHDFPGQGTAPIGVLDVFWESKGYVTPQAFRRFCGPTVPLARMQQLVFTNDAYFEARVDLAHYGPEPIQAEAVWYLRDQAGRVLSSGALPKKTATTGGLTTLDTIRIPLARFADAQKLNFEVALRRTDIANDWDFWVYPARLALSKAEPKVYMTQSFDDEAISVLKDGGKVLLKPQPSRLKSDTLGTFKPIFWNRITFAAQREHTMGILCDPRHPVFASFPTDYHSNWQWWELLERSKPIVLDGLELADDPLIRVIDDWNLCRSLGLMFEAAVGNGKLFVCSMDIRNNIENRPVARQLRRSVLDYMGSDHFSPTQQLSIEKVKRLFTEPSILDTLNARVINTSSHETGHEGRNAIDNDPGTLWHSQWTSEAIRYPHEIQIELEEPIEITGFTALPRQDGSRNGWIRHYEFYVSQDAQQWGQPAASGSFSNNAELKTVHFENPGTGRFLRLVAIEGFGNDRNASLAILDILTE